MIFYDQCMFHEVTSEKANLVFSLDTCVSVSFYVRYNSMRISLDLSAIDACFMKLCVKS